MTTTVPLIYSFPEFLGVAEAVADHVITAQNLTLYNSTDPKEIELIKNNVIQRPTLSNSISTNSINTSSNSHINLMASPSLGKKTNKKKPVKDVRFKIAISGGSLIKIFNQGLVNRQHEVQWDKWDIYFADERLVPFESNDSNYGQAKREIFDHIVGAKPNIYHIDESLINDAQECADNYEKLLIGNFAKKDSVKLPMFDLLLLGCAPDGHIASLFPNHGEALREKLAWCIPVSNAPAGPSNRVTLTIPVICHAHRVTFVVEGVTKAPIMRTIMERPEKGLPSSIVNEGAAGRVTWFVDDDALNDCYDITKKKYKFLSINKPNDKIHD